MPSSDRSPAGDKRDDPDAGTRTDTTAAAFTSIDWDAIEQRRLPDSLTTAFLLALAALALCFAYDFLVAPDKLVAALNWDLTRVDWLTVLAGLLLLRYGIAPLLVDRERSAGVVRAFLRRPLAVVSLAYLLVFAIAGIIGPDAFFSLEYPRLRHRFQPPVFFTLDPDKVFYFNCVGEMSSGVCHGTWQYPLGTTRFGQNLLRLLMYGMRIGLQLGLSAGLIMVVFATTVGTLAGYYGGWIDDVLMSYVDFQRAVPAILVYLALSAALFGNQQDVMDGRMFVLILVFGLLNWGGMARLIRSDVLTQRSAGYIRAAKSAGASDLDVIRRHVIPNIKGTVVTSLTRRIPLLILAQVALAYLEFNRVNSRSLGRLLRFAHVGNEWEGGAAAIPWPTKWWMSVFPILFLACTVLAFNFLGDSLRDLLDVEEKTDQQ